MQVRRSHFINFRATVNYELSYFLHCFESLVLQVALLDFFFSDDDHSVQMVLSFIYYQFCSMNICHLYNSADGVQYNIRYSQTFFNSLVKVSIFSCLFVFFFCILKPGKVSKETDKLANIILIEQF